MDEPSKILQLGVYYLLCAFLFLLFFVGDASGVAFLLPLIFVTLLLEPGKTPWLGIFCISLVQDTLSGTPLGFYASLYGLYGLFLMSQRKYLFKRAFLLTWVVFLVTTLIFLLARESVLALMTHVFNSPSNWLMEGGFIALMFPPLFRFLTWIHVLVRRRHES